MYSWYSINHLLGAAVLKSWWKYITLHEFLSVSLLNAFVCSTSQEFGLKVAALCCEMLQTDFTHIRRGYFTHIMATSDATIKNMTECITLCITNSINELTVYSCCLSAVLQWWIHNNEILAVMTITSHMAGKQTWTRLHPMLTPRLVGGNCESVGHARNLYLSS